MISNKRTPHVSFHMLHVHHVAHVACVFLQHAELLCTTKSLASWRLTCSKKPTRSTTSKRLPARTTTGELRSEQPGKRLPTRKRQVRRAQKGHRSNHSKIHQQGRRQVSCAQIIQFQKVTHKDTTGEACSEGSQIKLFKKSTSKDEDGRVRSDHPGPKCSPQGHDR